MKASSRSTQCSISCPAQFQVQSKYGHERRLIVNYCCDALWPELACCLQVAQLQADVGHYQGQADAALRESESWQHNVQQLQAELDDKARRASEFNDMQAEVSLAALHVLCPRPIMP